MVWSEGGRGSRAHSPELVVACVPVVPVVAHVLIVTHVLVVTPVLVIAHVHSWALAIIREARWPLWLVVVRARRGSWVMVKGARRRGWWWSRGSGFVVVVICGWLSSSSPWVVTLWALVVVRVGVVVHVFGLWSFVGGCGGGCDRLVMVVGGGGCWRRAVCMYWTWGVVVVCCAFVVSWSLWPFVAVCVHRRRCGWSSPFAVWVVVIGRRVS